MELEVEAQEEEEGKVSLVETEPRPVTRSETEERPRPLTGRSVGLGLAERPVFVRSGAELHEEKWVCYWCCVDIPGRI